MKPGWIESGHVPFEDLDMCAELAASGLYCSAHFRCVHCGAFVHLAGDDEAWALDMDGQPFGEPPKCTDCRQAARAARSRAQGGRWRGQHHARRRR